MSDKVCVPRMGVFSMYGIDDARDNVLFAEHEMKAVDRCALPGHDEELFSEQEIRVVGQKRQERIHSDEDMRENKKHKTFFSDTSTQHYHNTVIKEAMSSVRIENKPSIISDRDLVYNLLQARVYYVQKAPSEEIMTKVKKLYVKYFASMRKNDVVAITLMCGKERQIQRKELWFGFLQWYLNMCDDKNGKSIAEPAQIWTWGITKNSKENHGHNFALQLKSLQNKERAIKFECDEKEMVKLGCEKFALAAFEHGLEDIASKVDAKAVWERYVVATAVSRVQKFAGALLEESNSFCLECIAFAAGMAASTLCRTSTWKSKLSRKISCMGNQTEIGMHSMKFEDAKCQEW